MIGSWSQGHLNVWRSNRELTDYQKMLGRFAETVEEEEEGHGDGAVDRSGDQEMHAKKPLGLSEENPPDQHDHALLHPEKDEGQSEAAEGVLGVNAASDGGRQIADHGLGDAVQAEGLVTEAVLQDADDQAEEQPGGRIAAAQTEIEDDEERELEEFGPVDIDGQKSLQHECEDGDNGDGAGIELVHLDVRFGAKVDFSGVRHWRGASWGVFSGDGLAAGVAEDWP